MGGSGVVVFGKYKGRSINTTARGDLVVSAFFKSPKITDDTVSGWELIGSEWISIPKAMARYARAITWSSYADQSSLRGQVSAVLVHWADGAQSQLKLEDELFQHFATLLAGRRGAPAARHTAPAPTFPPPSPEPQPDLVARLERLAHLHRSGSLTDDEFAAAKAGLLRGRQGSGAGQGIDG